MTIVNSDQKIRNGIKHNFHRMVTVIRAYSQKNTQKLWSFTQIITVLNYKQDVIDIHENKKMF